MSEQNEPPLFSENSKSLLPTILILFLALRLTVLFLFTPQGLFHAYTDNYHYFRTALLSEQGYFPFINMWYEYPPLSAYLVQFAYWLTTRILSPDFGEEVLFSFFSRIFGLIVLIFDTGVLIMIHRLTAKAWGLIKANWASWVYLSLSLPMFYASFGHGIIAVFFFLLGLYLFIDQKERISAVAIGLGFVAKLSPFIFLAPAAKFIWQPKWKRIIQYGAILVITVALIYLPFILLGGTEWIQASFRAWGKAGSWSTIWALIDGNWASGDYGPLINRTVLEMASVRQGNPPVVPEIIKTGFTALIFGWLWLKPVKENSPKNVIYFTTLTVMLYLLWSKGWSPSWVTLILPFVLITFPNQRGLKTLLILTLITIIEWPLVGFLGGRIFLPLTIFARTLFFIVIAVWCYQALWGQRAASETA